MLILVLVLAVLAYFVVDYFYRNVYVFNNRVRRFPSPPSVPLLGHALDFVSRGSLDVLIEYTQRYGENVLIKTGPKRSVLCTSDYKLLQFILNNHHILEKSVDYRNLYRWLGTGLLTSGGDKWKSHRHLITPTFHYHILEEFVDVFESKSQILVDKLRRHVGEKSFNIYHYITLCTLDIICESAMGTCVNAQENSDSDYVKSVKEMCRIIVERSFSAHKMFDTIYFFTEDYRKERKALKILHDYTTSVISQRIASLGEKQPISEPVKKKRLALLDLLLRETTKAGQLLTNDEIRQEVDTFMFAGHDTTGSAISFLIYSLANHPDIQEKVFQEQKKIFANDHFRPTSTDDAREMKYLECVIKETLRLYPSAPFIAREVDKDTLYEGDYLPKGLTITLFVFGLHRNPKYFPDPEKFDPDRFNDRSSSLPFSYLPFSAGARNCIGQRFAMSEMKSVISKLVRHFEFLPPDPPHELHLASQTVLISTNGINVGMKNRRF